MFPYASKKHAAYLIHKYDIKKKRHRFIIMEIKIQSLDTIREAAREFIKAMGEHTVFAFYGKMEQERPLSSKPSVKNWA